MLERDLGQRQDSHKSYRPGRSHLGVSVSRHEKRSEEQGWGSPIFRGEDEETPGNAEREQLERQGQNKDRSGFRGPGEHRNATCWGPGSVRRGGTVAPHLTQLGTRI